MHHWKSWASGAELLSLVRALDQASLWIEKGTGPREQGRRGRRRKEVKKKQGRELDDRMED